MPELPEAEEGRRLATLVLKGRRIAEVAVREDPIVFLGLSARQVRAALRGRRVEAVRRKGKHIWMELDRRPWPAFHFGMTGDFRLYRSPAERPPFWKLELTSDRGDRFAMTDVRRFGRIRLLRDPEREPPISLLGYDPLVGLPPTFELQAVLQRRKAPLKAVLLDQSVFAGVGNWIADEVLYQAGLSPHRPASSLSRVETARLRRRLHAIVRRAVAVRGDSDRFPRSWLFHVRWGRNAEARTWRAERIIHETVGGRTTAWAPTRQR